MAIRRKKANKETLLRRAHLGNLDNAEDLLNLARQNNIKTAPLDIEALIKLLGVEMRKEDNLESDVSGKLTRENDTWICIVNANHHPTRQRFTMAHELAHYVLHRNEQTEFVDHTYFRAVDNANPMEFEANAFAGSLLMPKMDFKHFIINTSTDVEKLAEHFGVSPIAVRVRAKQLGFIEGK